MTTDSDILGGGVVSLFFFRRPKSCRFFFFPLAWLRVKDRLVWGELDKNTLDGLSKMAILSRCQSRSMLTKTQLMKEKLLPPATLCVPSGRKPWRTSDAEHNDDPKENDQMNYPWVFHISSIAGWWLGHPSEKYGPSIGMMKFPILMGK